MKVGLGILRWPPGVFWMTSLLEYEAAYSGYLESIGASKTAGRRMTRDRISELLKLCPDIPP